MRAQGMSDRARLFVVPLVVLSVVLVALMVAIAVVVVVRKGANAAGENDPCVVGTWRVIAHREDVALPNVGTVTFNAEGDGPSVRLNADGTAVTDYGTGTRYAGTALRQTIRLDVRGTVRYRYAASGGKFSVQFKSVTSDAKGTIFLDGTRYREVPFSGSADPASYECSQERMVQRTDAFETTLTRLDFVRLFFRGLFPLGEPARLPPAPPLAKDHGITGGAVP